MKSLKILWKEVAIELATWCCTSADLDYKKLEIRVEGEGVSFLTITLPNFGKDFERCLDQGWIDSSAFVGFQRRRGPLPLFLGGFLNQIFDSHSGVLLDEPNIDCIYAVRQLTLMFGKILLPCTEVRERRAMERFVECEQEIRAAAEVRPKGSRLDFRRMAAVLFGDSFSFVDKMLSDGEVTPKHGPGATADRLSGNRKYDQCEWPLRLERIFPFGEYALPNWRYKDQLDHVDFLELDAEKPVRVISVPKTLKTPRIIAIEPTCMQYMQQAILQPIVQSFESEKLPGYTRENLVSSFIGITDQNPNRDLARDGSMTTELATLDLSEASDRVLNEHVLDLLVWWPTLNEAVQATRSRKALVLDKELDLVKFASMGSALCFPMEAAVFLTVIFLGIQKKLNTQLTRRDIKSFRGAVRVYGDDIIVPTDMVDCVIEELESFGFKVNNSKSFWNGKFRESCGGDYYDGTDVTPVRVRRTLPQSRTDVEEVISLVSLRNQFYFKGLWRTASMLDRWIARVLPRFPVVETTSPVLGRNSFLAYEPEKLCPSLHRPLVRGYVVTSVPPNSSVSGIGALVKCLTKQGQEPFADVKHLERQGRPDAVNIKLRWSPPY